MEALIRSRASISNDEVADLYKTIPNMWVLLKPIEMGENNRAIKVEILSYNDNKDVLRDQVMENDNWLGLGSLIYFFTGSDGTCNI